MTSCVIEWRVTPIQIEPSPARSKKARHNVFFRAVKIMAISNFQAEVLGQLPAVNAATCISAHYELSSNATVIKVGLRRLQASYG
jgi:hypothetical protein